MKKILIIGGCGFIGHNLAIHLNNLNYKVDIVDSLNVNNLNNFKENVGNNEFYRLVLNNRLELLARNNINYEIIDSNPEWRYYGNDDSKYSDPTRVGLPTNALLPQSSLGSTISFKYGESYEMKKIRNYQIKIKILYLVTQGI